MTFTGVSSLDRSIDKTNAWLACPADPRLAPGRRPGWPAPTSSTSCRTASGQALTFARGPVWMVLAAR
jgi:hypothetical protein